MSKSTGNAVNPLKVLQKHGADILRLWVASMNYFVDVRISDEILTQISDAYRKVRNTFRFLLGNCYDFDLKKNAVSYDNMKDIDLFVLRRFSTLLEDCREFYENFEFHRVFRSIYHFCTIELSSFYLDIMKNKLYTDHPDSPDRRSAQTAMHIIADGLCKALSPLIPFTTDEVWENFRKPDAPESVHLSEWPAFRLDKDTSEVEKKYGLLLGLRNQVLAKLEEARNEKLIGSALGAKVHLSIADDALYQLLKHMDAQETRELFIVSEVKLEKCTSKKEHLIEISKAEGTKCVRCWQFKKTVGSDPQHSEICAECLSVIIKLEQDK